jgi:hypothetical protein
VIDFINREIDLRRSSNSYCNGSASGRWAGREEKSNVGREKKREEEEMKHRLLSVAANRFFKQGSRTFDSSPCTFFTPTDQ